MIQVRRYNSIHDIDAGHWDSILDDGDVFHTWRFIRIVEDGKVEASKFRYLLFYRDEVLVGSTVLSGFTISLDIFITDAAWVRTLKKLRPTFFNIGILTCGLPASFGQLNIKITDAGLHNEVCSIIATEMKFTAREWGIRYMAVKEFLTRNVAMGKQLQEEGFFLANSIPYMSLKLGWNNFEEYLAALRHSYRRHAVQALRKIGHDAPRIIPAEEYEATKPEVAWVLSAPAWLRPEQYHQLYMQVMSRTKTKLETLNLDFFKELFTDEGFRLLSLVHRGQVVSSAVLVKHGDTLTFMLVGREQEKDEYDSYFNLVSGIISYALSQGVQFLKMGQTAYWVKQSVGAMPEDQFLYFGCRGKIRHAILKRLNKAIFPEVTIHPIRAFKSPGHASAILSE